MDRGVVEVHAPDGRVWWVKRAWIPRYLTLRDRVARALQGRRRRWYTAPLRWFAFARRRDVIDVPSDAVYLLPDPPADGDDAADLGSGPDSGDVGAVADDGDFGSPPDGGDFGDPPDGGDFGPAPTIAEGLPASDGVLVTGADEGVGGGFDLDGDELAVLVLVVVGVLAAVLVAWFVLLPLLLVVVDGLVLLAVVLLAGLVRLLFRRPWDVVAEHDRSDGARLVRRWEVRGFRRAGRARDDVAQALRTGTDPDLAVVRVLVREPMPGDRAGGARSARETRPRDGG